MTNYSTMAFFASDDVRAIKCIFVETQGNYPSGVQKDKKYTYKTFDKDLKVDDLVVVQCTGPSNYFGYCVVKVVEVDADILLSGNLEYKWIVSKFDLTEFEDTLKTEKQIIKEIRKHELNAGKSKFKKALGLVEDAVLKLTSFK